MPAAENTVIVQRPIGDVFAFLADGENNRRWRPAVVDIARVSGDGVGTRYRQGVKGPFGRRVDADYEITALEPDRRIEFRTVTGPVRPEGSFELGEAEGGTRVTFRLSYEPGGIGRLMSPMVAASMRSEVGNLENLRTVLEGRAST
jgi:uncharacterized membrane protein